VCERIFSTGLFGYREQRESPCSNETDCHRQQRESPRTLVPPRLAARFAHSVRCSAYFVGAATSARPLSVPPAQTVEPADTGGNERGRSLREGGRSKHRRSECNERRGAQRDPRPERAGAFRLFAVIVVAVPFGAFRLFAVIVVAVPFGAFRLFAVIVVAVPFGAFTLFPVAVVALSATIPLSAVAVTEHSRSRRGTKTDHSTRNRTVASVPSASAATRSRSASVAAPSASTITVRSST